jgi:aquaporin Z
MLGNRNPHAQQSTRRTPDLLEETAAATLGRQLTVEFIGTFILVFTVGVATSRKGAGGLAPVAIGSALMVMVFAGGHISGAHYNPAVSFAALVAGKLRALQAAIYIVTQLVAGTAAALLVRAYVGRASPGAFGSDWKILVGEFIFTLALAYVVLNVTVAEATRGNSFFGLAIGFTVVTGALAVGKTTGGAFNLAVALGGSVTGALTWSHIWIYLIASLVGGASAAGLFGFLHPLEENGRGPSRAVEQSVPEPLNEDYPGRDVIG